MGEILLFREYRNKGEFKINYPYYGLFGSADITPINQEDEIRYQCRLLNGSILHLKKLAHLKKWIDISLNMETPLAAVIGLAIEDFLKISGEER
jgi:hypothetical protein